MGHAYNAHETIWIITDLWLGSKETIWLEDQYGGNMHGVRNCVCVCVTLMHVEEVQKNALAAGEPAWIQNTGSLGGWCVCVCVCECVRAQTYACVSFLLCAVKGKHYKGLITPHKTISGLIWKGSHRCTSLIEFTVEEGSFRQSRAQVPENVLESYRQRSAWTSRSSSSSTSRAWRYAPEWQTCSAGE